MLRRPNVPFIVDNLISTKMVHDNINNKFNNSNNTGWRIMHTAETLYLHAIINLFDLYSKCSQIGIELM